MLKKFINELETFAVNENLEPEIISIGTEGKIVIVDNFYKNPELVRDLALAIPPTTNERILNNLPTGPTSGRINAFYLLDHLGPVYDKIIRSCYPELSQYYAPGYFESSFQRATFMCNVMTSNNLPPRLPHIDHTDRRLLASLIYLNTPDECAGGTGFYSFKNKLIGENKFRTHIDDTNLKEPDHFVVDDLDDWKLEYIAEMKFNRMVIYSQNIHHSAYIKPNMFTGNTYRLNQVFFI